jgi:hypothetical protein
MQRHGFPHVNDLTDSKYVEKYKLKIIERIDFARNVFIKVADLVLYMSVTSLFSSILI